MERIQAMLPVQENMIKQLRLWNKMGKKSMNGILWAFAGTLFTFFVTALGALNVFFVKREITGSVQRLFLGFAGGVMTAASIWSLLIPGISAAEENGQLSCVVIPVGFLLGVGLLLVADYLLKKKYEKMRTGGKKISLSQNTVMLVLAITVHNIPEGMSVGLAFALAAQHMEEAAFLSGALALALGIGIQNYPEGTAVALPLIAEGMPKGKAFFLGAMSAVVEPIFGVLAAVLAQVIAGIMPMLLALAAGCMIYVVVEELIPEAHMNETGKSGLQNVGTLGFIVGFLVMMILDVAL